MGIELLAKNQMHIVPSSPEVASGKFYACSVDVCEVGIQFCNVLDNRCVYCSDHHQDCFTNVQQQNCTLYCQDQWLKNLKVECSSQGHAEDKFKIPFIVTSVLVFVLGIVIIVMILKMTGICNLQHRVFMAIRKMFKKKTQSQPDEHDIEEKMFGEEQQESVHDTATKESRNNENVENEEIHGQHQKPSESEISFHKNTLINDSEKVTSLPDVVIEQHQEPNKFRPEPKTDRPSVKKQDSVEYPISKTSHVSDSEDETELLKKHNDAGIVYQRTESPTVLNLPHGELPTMSSRGSYQAFLHSNQSTDDGYVTHGFKPQN
ncbi:uncharacterized protein LOC132742594 [Ruditapes philippinarum]|uniref:uncharacterized protein LOC132742594 n=1 Tax=Ruditapes philippinarum TaxID=129788 RepID=UPI00295BDA4A|nr:uncharacterized protein LOC132742594 [Ruditapes philippinarum]